MPNKRLGQAFVICAPSGTGKSTLIKRLTAEFGNFAFSVSYTTRSPRPGEENGVHYHFVSTERFQELKEQMFFAEWAEVHGNFYGTPLRATLDLLNDGKDVIFDIDVQGARQLRKTMHLGCYVFLLPPSRESLVERLGKRASDTPEVVALRLRNAHDEIKQAMHFDYLVVNDDLDQAYQDLRTVYLAQRLTPVRNPGLVESILRGWEG